MPGAVEIIIIVVVVVVAAWFVGRVLWRTATGKDGGVCRCDCKSVCDPKKPDSKQ